MRGFQGLVAKAGVTGCRDLSDLRPRAQVQSSAEIQSVVRRSIVAKTHSALQSLIRDFARQDFLCPRIILKHARPLRSLRHEGSQTTVRSNVKQITQEGDFLCLCEAPDNVSPWGDWGIKCRRQLSRPADTMQSGQRYSSSAQLVLRQLG